MDVIGSPNYGYFVFNGTSLPAPAHVGGRVIQQYFVDYFKQYPTIEHKVVPFILQPTTTDNSDYLPFVLKGARGKERSRESVYVCVRVCVYVCVYVCL